MRVCVASCLCVCGVGGVQMHVGGQNTISGVSSYLSPCFFLFATVLIRLFDSPVSAPPFFLQECSSYRCVPLDSASSFKWVLGTPLLMPMPVIHWYVL